MSRPRWAGETSKATKEKLLNAQLALSKVKPGDSTAGSRGPAPAQQERSTDFALGFLEARARLETPVKDDSK